jgi:polysaccharide chain length determinant protein (PEP-CTERM system associated)
LIDKASEAKAIDAMEYLRIAVRRRWWLMGPTFVIGFVALGAALVWPPSYRSEAMILVEQQKIPSKYVTPNVVSDLDSRLKSMTQEILSRTRLESLIKQFNLYPGQRTQMTMDEVVDLMRKDIAIELAQASEKEDQPTLMFHISYSAESPQIAQQLNSELTSLFIEKSLEARAQQSASTTSFLQSQLETARKDLAQQEERLRQYKMRYLGELPQQEQSNLQILNSFQVQLQASTDALGRAEQQRIYLQSLRSEYQAMAQSPGPGNANSPTAPGAVPDAALRDLHKQLSELQAKYTLKHPDVVRVQKQIAEWEQLKKRVVETPSDSKGTPEVADQPALAEVDSRLKAIEVEIGNNKQQVEKLRKQIDNVQGRLSLTPVREQQLAEVTRNYQNSRENYQSLLEKEMQSELATNLEKRQEGEQFRIIDPPSLPVKPNKPNRPLILLSGWLFGLCAGVGAAGLREFTDTTLSSEEDLKKQIRAPILARIPVLYSLREWRYRRIYRVLEVTVVALLMAGSLVLAFYIYILS